MRLAALALAVALCGCSQLERTARVGIVGDESVKALLAVLSVVDEGPCNGQARGGKAVFFCRVFENHSGDRIIGVYDRITDELFALVEVLPDGRQRTIWQPNRTRPNQAHPVAL